MSTNFKTSDAMLLSRARRMALRKRAEKACIECHSTKTRCSGYRPCKRCVDRHDVCQDFSKNAGGGHPNSFYTEKLFVNEDKFNYIYPTTTLLDSFGREFELVRQPVEFSAGQQVSRLIRNKRF